MIPTPAASIVALVVYTSRPGTTLVSIMLEYVLLDGGSADLAPALLVLGYVILITLGVI